MFFLGRYWLFVLSCNIGNCISVSVTSAAEFVEILSIPSFLLGYNSSVPAGKFSAYKIVVRYMIGYIAVVLALCYRAVTFLPEIYENLWCL